MDSATEDLYFQKMEELIQDEDKIVTIPYLSRSLKLTVQDSEKLLSKYLKDQRKLKPNELATTYILKGIVKDKGSGVFFIKEDDLKEKRSLFDKIDSEVLFSIQKCKQIDLDVLALVDDVTKPCTEPLLGSIVGKNCVKRVLKVKKLPTPPPSTIKGKSSFFMSKTESSSSVEKSEPKPKQNGIAGLFSKAAATQSPKDNKDTAQKKTTGTSKQPSQKGGLSTFLSKGSSSSSVKSENGIKKEKTISTTISSQPSEIEELMEIDFYEEMDEVTVDDKKIKKEEENKSEQKDTNKKEVKKSGQKDTNKKEVKEKKQEVKEKRNKNKRQREKSEEKSIKKRKRIVQRNDSESDDMFENDEEDIIDVSEDEPERVPSPVASKPLAPKNKIRKAIDNTYMDEEGFIVTKTEYIYESAPEEVEEPKKEKEIKAPKLEKKTSASSENDVSPKKGKNKKGKKNNNLQNQPTLMNFFKKK